MSSNRPFFIFDLDGTLFDTLPDLAPAVNYAITKFGLEALSNEKIQSYIGNGSRNLIMRAIGDADVSLDDAHKAFFEYYRVHCTERTLPYPGVLEFLKRDFRCALLTNKPHAPTKRILSHFGLLGRFEMFLGGDTSPARKPDPAGLLQIAKTCGVDLADVIMVGDDTPDLLVSRNAGVRNIMILNGFGKPHNILPLSPERTVEHFKDLLLLTDLGI